MMQTGDIDGHSDWCVARCARVTVSTAPGPRCRGGSGESGLGRVCCLLFRSCKINLRRCIVDVPKSALSSCEKRWAPLKTPIEPPPRSPEPLRLEGAALARHRAGAPPAPKRGSGPPSSPAAAAGSTSSTLSAASLARPPLSRLSGSATAVHHRSAVAGPIWMRKVQKWVRAFVTPQHGLI